MLFRYRRAARSVVELGIVNLARPKGLEPLTGGLETRCSIRLSYERVLCVL